MKKLLSFLLVAILVMSLAPITHAEEVYRVRLGFPTMQAIPDAAEIKKVEDAINDHIHNDLGIADIELQLDFLSLFEYATNMNMMLASGEKWDIAFTLNDLTTAVQNGYFVDLTPYLENELAGAVSYVKDWLGCGTVNGTVYAIPCYKGQVLSWKYIYDEKFGDAYDMSQVHDLASLDEALAAMHEKYPDERFEVYMNQSPNLFNFRDHVSQVGTYLATIGDSTQLVNYYATDTFREACEYSYRHRQLGYADPEGSSNTLSHDAVVMSGASKGVVMGHAYSIETVEQMFTMNNTYGATFKAQQIAVSDMTNNTLTYGIPYTSQNVPAAARMMNLIWTDEFIASALIYGLEGVSYEWNEGHTSIQYPAGLSLDTVPYTALYTCGAFGNQFLLYGFDGNTSEEDKQFMLELIQNAWYPPLFGFMPSSDNVSTQVAAVSNVSSQYLNALTYGDVDPAEFLPQFLTALEGAGINDILADYQAQVDAWLATK